jgi:hypothetical protein
MTHKIHEYNTMLNEVSLFMGFSGHLVEITGGILLNFDVV